MAEGPVHVSAGEPTSRGRARTVVTLGRLRGIGSAGALDAPGPPDDPVRRFARWIRRSFPDTDDASASVISAWLTAAFLRSACERLASDLTRLGHTGDGSAEQLARVAMRVDGLTSTLRTPPGAGERPQITASQLDEIRRQLRVEAATVARCVTAVAADDAHASPLVPAIVDAATWLAVEDLRGAVDELHSTAGDDAPGVRTTLEALHAAVAPSVGVARPRSLRRRA